MDIFSEKIKNFFILGFILLFIFLPVFSQNILADSTANFQIEIIPGPQCYDGQDNDEDGLVDYPDDPGCDSQSDNDENDNTVLYCGDGFCNNGENCGTCDTDCGACPSGGGGSLIIQPTTSVTFSGKAYPLNKVTILKDGQKAITTIAGPDANFNVSLTGLSSGNYTFSVYGEDNVLRRSTLFTFSVFITRGATTKISGIFINPTIDVNKSEVKRGDNIVILGQSVPNSEITIVINSNKEMFVKTNTDKNGIYLYNLDTSSLAMEQHFAESKSIYNGKISSFGRAVSFIVGTKNISKTPSKFLKGDLNNDEKVNLVDFSIIAFWYKKPFPPINVDLNKDGKIDLVDFSIMAFYWTG